MDKNNTVISFEGKDIDLIDVIRIYTSVLIEYDGDVSDMSLQWVKEHFQQIKILEFRLNIDFSESSNKKKIVLNYPNENELLDAVKKLYIQYTTIKESLNL